MQLLIENFSKILRRLLLKVLFQAAAKVYSKAKGLNTPVSSSLTITLCLKKSVGLIFG